MVELIVGVIGCGYWGPNHIRNFREIEGVTIKYMCDANQDMFKRLKKNYPNIDTINDHKKMLMDKTLDAVVIATPTRTHYNIAKEALENEKHVLVEKPMTTSVEECKDLIYLAEKKQKVLMVGHTFAYHSALNHLEESIAAGELGSLYYCKSERTGLSPVRMDVNATWDLAAHDIGIAESLFKKCAANVFAKGSCHLNQGKSTEDVVQLCLDDEDGRTFAYIHVNWLDTLKRREIVITGDTGTAIFDDIPADKKLRICKRSIDYIKPNVPFGEFQCQTRLGDEVIPAITLKEPLKVQAEHFIDCIINGKTPKTDGVYGMNVVAVLVAAQKSLKEKKPIEVKY